MDSNEIKQFPYYFESLTTNNLPYEKVGNKEPVCIADEVPFEIPDSWEWVRLGNISNYDGKKTKINAAEADRSLWELDLEDIEKGGRLLTKKSVGERNAVGDKTIFHAGDILYSKLRPYLLKILVAPSDGICTSEIVPFSVYGKINSEYIVYYLKSPVLDFYINSITYGIKMPRVGTSTMTNLLVPLPPLNEQQRVVSKLKRLLPYVEKYNIVEVATSELNKTFPDQLKKSILQLAVQGKLVPQDPNDEPASVLLDRIHAEKERLIKSGKIKRDKHESVIYRRDNSHYEMVDGMERCIDDEIPFEIPNSWQWVRLKTLTMKIGSGSTPPGGKSVYVSNGIKFLRSQNVYNDGLRMDGIVYITEEMNSKKSASVVRPQDILLNITGGSIGRCAIVPDNFDIANINQHVMIIRLIDQSLKYWIHVVLISEYIQNKIMEVQVGVSREGLSAEKLEQFLIPIPSINEMSRILSQYTHLRDIIGVTD